MEDRLFRLRCLVVFLIMFIKVVLNQYPVLYDYSLLVFIVTCCYRRVLIKHIEGYIAIIFIIAYTSLMTFYMWLTWLQSF